MMADPRLPHSRGCFVLSRDLTRLEDIEMRCAQHVLFSAHGQALGRMHPAPPSLGAAQWIPSRGTP